MPSFNRAQSPLVKCLQQAEALHWPKLHSMPSIFGRRRCDPRPRLRPNLMCHELLPLVLSAPQIHLANMPILKCPNQQPTGNGLAIAFTEESSSTHPSLIKTSSSRTTSLLELPSAGRYAIPLQCVAFSGLDLTMCFQQIAFHRNEDRLQSYRAAQSGKSSIDIYSSAGKLIRRLNVRDPYTPGLNVTYTRCAVGQRINTRLWLV
jgi:hypothetical protein